MLLVILHVLNACLRVRHREGRGSFVITALTIIAVLFSQAIHSNSSLAEPNPLAQAKQHNSKAKEYFNLGQFLDAAREYERAYHISKLPEFLYNLGQCYKRQADLEYNRPSSDLEYKEKAVHYIESYLNNVASIPNREDIVREVETIKQRLQQLREQIKTDENRQKNQTLALQLAQRSERDNTTVTSTPFYRRWWFWTAVGVVVAGTTTALIISLAPNVDPVVGTLPPGEVTIEN